MSLARELANAEGRYLARRAGWPCPHRMERVGTRPCMGCGGAAILRDLYRCARRAEGVTVEEDCRVCAERPAGSDRVLEGNRRTCLRCPRHREERGVIRCELCRCDDPWRHRAWCPSKRWGLEAWERARRGYEKGRG